MNLPKDDLKNIYISWPQYHQLIYSLALNIKKSNWQFNSVLCLARGGLRVGDQLSRLFKVPLAILSTHSYRNAENKIAGKIQGTLNIAKHITMATEVLHGSVLLVDDLVDSGITLEKVQAHLKNQYKSISEIRTAVIWYKACSLSHPNYYAMHLPHNPWIHQPFEEWDNMPLNSLEHYLL